SCAHRRWVRYFDGQRGDDFAVAMAIGKHREIYVTAKSWVDTCRGWLTVALSPNGDSIGAQRLTGTACGGTNTYPSGIAVGSSGDVYVAGQTAEATSTIVLEAMTVVKYSSDLSTIRAKYVGRNNGNG